MKTEFMLNRITNLFKSNEPAEKLAEEENVANAELKLTVDTTEVVAELDAIRTEFETKLTEATDLMAAAHAALSEMTAKYEAATTALAVFEAEKAQLIADALAVKMTARKEKIVAAIGTAKADALMAATESLGDTAFDAVVSAMTGSIEAEAKTEAFKETGVSAEADAASVTESKEMKLLKQKYPQSK